MKTSILLTMMASVFLAQAVQPPTNETPWLQYGALGVLSAVLAALFFKVLPDHQGVIRDVVKEHKDGLHRIADTHREDTKAIVEEIKTCRLKP